MKTVKLLALVLFISTASFAQTQQDANTTVATPQVQSQLKWETEVHDFGTIEKGKPVTYEFTFTNTTKKDILLTSVRASCGCTATNYTKTTIKPGEKGFVSAEYNAAAPGTFHKTVTITTNEENVAPKIITIKGTVKADEVPAPAPQAK